MRRRLLWCAGGITLGPLAMVMGRLRADDVRVIKIVARRFEFEPSIIALRLGEAVTLEVTSLDYLHGFSVPSLAIRGDVPAGHTFRATIKPPRAGSYTMVCDNFCGDDHDEMSGKIIVT
ncbi:MAG: cupredoxin domain-containing protein [Burkholderiales bacterium]